MAGLGNNYVCTPDDKYVCSLDEFSLKVAREELNEDPKERKSQVETFRKWILDQKHLKCPTDIDGLLPYLRTAKFSQLRARTILEGQLKNKSRYPDWLADIDMANPKIIEVLKAGYTLVLPRRLPNKRLLVFTRTEGLENLIDRKVDKNDILKAMCGIGIYYMRNESDMVNGFEMFQDFSHFSMKHVQYWGLDTMKKMARLAEGNSPGRFKGFHYFNTGPVFETIISVTKPLASKKHQNRMNVYGRNLEDVYKKIPMDCFPLDYLPDDYEGPSQGTIQELTDNLLMELTKPEMREFIWYRSRAHWCYDFSMKPDDDVPAASFRKLNVD